MRTLFSAIKSALGAMLVAGLFLFVTFVTFDSTANAKTWECGSGVDYSTGVPIGDWVRSCDLGDPDDPNSIAFDLMNNDRNDEAGSDDDEDRDK